MEIIFEENDEGSKGITASPVLACIALVELKKAVIQMLGETTKKSKWNVWNFFATVTAAGNYKLEFFKNGARKAYSTEHSLNGTLNHLTSLFVKINNRLKWVFSHLLEKVKIEVHNHHNKPQKFNKSTSADTRN